MKLLFVGDMHLRSATPSRRKDDFASSQFSKVSQIFDIANKNDAVIIQTGDIFDTESSDIKTMVRYLPMFLSYGRGVYSAIGNHDVYGASLDTVPRTALGLFASVGAVSLLGHEPVVLDNSKISICGTSYMHAGDPKPSPEADHNILVVHDMILENKIWKEQDNFTYAYDYAIQHSGWDVILCGHYHYSFEHRQGKVLVINPGAVVRIKASKGDMALKPSVVLYDTNTRKSEWVMLEHALVEDVFHPAETTPVAAVNPALEEFVASLTPEVKNEIVQGSIVDVTLQVLREVGCRPAVADLIKHYLGKAEELS